MPLYTSREDSIYPTKREILAQEEIFDTDTIKATLEWKTEWLHDWKSLPNNIKNIALKDLIYRICQVTPQKHSPCVSTSDQYAYDPNFTTILIDGENPSIISTLHELGHHIKGLSELDACRWSVWLFKKCFPVQFKKLSWKGHMLVRKL
jgi:hypothetical protein